MCDAFLRLSSLTAYGQARYRSHAANKIAGGILGCESTEGDPEMVFDTDWMDARIAANEAFVAQADEQIEKLERLIAKFEAKGRDTDVQRTLKTHRAIRDETERHGAYMKREFVYLRMLPDVPHTDLDNG